MLTNNRAEIRYSTIRCLCMYYHVVCNGQQDTMGIYCTALMCAEGSVRNTVIGVGRESSGEHGGGRLWFGLLRE